jgi:miniconductance mechanosensitive channel
MHMKDVGIDYDYVKSLLSFGALVLAGAKFFTGFLYDRCGLRITATILTFFGALAPIVLALVQNNSLGITLAVSYSIIAHLAMPLETVILPIYAADLFGSKDYAKMIGIFVSVNTAGYAAGSPILNVCYDLFGSYAPALIIVGIVMDKDPTTLLTGLGASAAILMLVFKDSIMGLVAGVQLSANDMLRPGDWIELPKYGADGNVIEVTLTTVKVQNWDKTITTIPPYVLVSDSFQNWRGMFDSGGRRIKRSIYIDMNSVGFCSAEQIKDYRSKGLVKETESERAVNLTLFREWLEEWLHNHPSVNKDMTIMVRQLQPTPQGLPLELYFFFNGTQWVQYEHFQAEIFEYVLAIMPEFGLKAFQSPSGEDISGMSAKRD